MKGAVYIGLTADLKAPLFLDGSGTGVATPNLSRFGALPKRTRIGRPNPSRFGAAPQRTRMGPPKTTRIGPPPTLYEREAAPFQQADS